MKKVFIFGTGNFGIMLMKKLKNKCDVIGFLDNKIRKDSINEIKVFLPSEIEMLKFDEIIIGSNSFNSIDDMVNQLIMMGIDKEKINSEYAVNVKTMNIHEIFALQYSRIEEKSRESFLRYNLIIQILAIEDMNGLNEVGIEISKKYRKIVMPGDDIDVYMENFKALVKSFKEEGFKDNSYISLNKKGELIDGTHRMALLIVNNIKKADVRLLNTYWQLSDERDIDWLTLHNDVFTQNEIDIIMKKYDEIKEKVLI